MIRSRKPFSSTCYQENNTPAYMYLKRDIEQYNQLHQCDYYPVLRPEDYNIDVAVYLSKQDYETGIPPVFFIELEIKTRNAGNWKPGNFPYSTIHFLYRKIHLLYQSALVFWVTYNSDGTDCAILNLESIPFYPIAQLNNKIGDLVYLIPISSVTFGTNKVMPAIENYIMAQVSVDDAFFQAHRKGCFNRANRQFRARIQFDSNQKEYKKLLQAQQQNTCTSDIQQFL